MLIFNIGPELNWGANWLKLSCWCWTDGKLNWRGVELTRVELLELNWRGVEMTELNRRGIEFTRSWIDVESNWRGVELTCSRIDAELNWPSWIRRKLTWRELNWRGVELTLELNWPSWFHSSWRGVELTLSWFDRVEVTRIDVKLNWCELNWRGFELTELNWLELSCWSWIDAEINWLGLRCWSWIDELSGWSWIDRAELLKLNWRGVRSTELSCWELNWRETRGCFSLEAFSLFTIFIFMKEEILSRSLSHLTYVYLTHTLLTLWVCDIITPKSQDTHTTHTHVRKMLKLKKV